MRVINIKSPIFWYNEKIGDVIEKEPQVSSDYTMCTVFSYFNIGSLDEDGIAILVKYDDGKTKLPAFRGYVVYKRDIKKHIIKTKESRLYEPIYPNLFEVNFRKPGKGYGEDLSVNLIEYVRDIKINRSLQNTTIDITFTIYEDTLYKTLMLCMHDIATIRQELFNRAGDVYMRHILTDISFINYELFNEYDNNEDLLNLKVRFNSGSHCITE